MEYFVLEKDEGVTTLTINRPERLDAFNSEMGRELLRKLMRLNSKDRV